MQDRALVSSWWLMTSGLYQPLATFELDSRYQPKISALSKGEM